MEALFILFIAAVIGLIPAAIASGKGRSFVGWWFFGMLMFIIALPASIIISTDHTTIKEKEISSGEKKKCPFCAELVLREAKICRFCQSTLPNIATEELGGHIYAEEQWKQNYANITR